MMGKLATFGEQGLLGNDLCSKVWKGIFLISWLLRWEKSLSKLSKPITKQNPILQKLLICLS